MRTLTAAVAISLLAGCVHTYGTPIDVERIRELRPGLSTVDDAKRIFGEPDMVHHSAQTGTCYMWRYGRAGLGVQTESKMVQACFDQDGKYATQQPVQVQVVK